MSFTFDLATDVGLVRLYTGDTDLAAASWTDEAIATVLAREGTVKGAAALLLETTFTKEGQAAAAALRAHTVDDSEGVFASVESVLPAFGAPPRVMWG